MRRSRTPIDRVCRGSDRALTRFDGLWPGLTGFEEALMGFARVCRGLTEFEGALKGFDGA